MYVSETAKQDVLYYDMVHVSYNQNNFRPFSKCISSLSFYYFAFLSNNINLKVFMNYKVGYGIDIFVIERGDTFWSWTVFEKMTISSPEEGIIDRFFGFFFQKTRINVVPGIFLIKPLVAYLQTLVFFSKAPISAHIFEF